jgi:general secretion pathway protein H
LIETLVVLLIMGLLIGLVSAVARPDPRGVLQVEAERLAQLLELAATESRLTGRFIGWTADETGYRFWRVREDGWSEIHDNDLLRPRALPQDMTIASLRVESMRPQGVMRLEFSPYVQTLAFTIELSSAAGRYAISASPMGEVRATPGEGTANGTTVLQ